jgi:hypothetical protein
VHASSRPHHERATAPGFSRHSLSKLNSVRDIEVDVVLGELGVLTAKNAIEGPSAYHHVLAVSLERR